MPQPPAAKTRFLKPDGSSNVVRLGQTQQGWIGDHYHALLTMAWPAFLATIAAVYLVTNALFALAYLACGDGIENARPGSFTDAFFFSIQTMATIGYGKLVPVGPAANALVALEALVGMLGLALATGIMFARFTRPTAGVLFSQRMVLTSFDGKPTLMLRMANQREGHILEASVDLVLVRSEVNAEGEMFRRFHDLPPTRARSPVFSLSWTVMHVIDHHSPLYGETAETLADGLSEIVVMFRGHHEGFAQTVHTRKVYSSDDIVWGGRFADVFTILPDGRRALDYRRFHEVEPWSDAPSSG